MEVRGGLVDPGTRSGVRGEKTDVLESDSD
jgi:hypothetical protein